MNDVVTEALLKAQRGWAVFPLAEGTKVPAVAGGRGCKDATRDAATVAAWWERWPSANIGILCGPRPEGSGVWVLDVDGDEGRASLAALVSRYGELPATLVVETPSGGQHWYFDYPSGRVIKNAVRLKGPDGNRLPGLDVRSANGYVVAPPSVVGGKAYVASSRRPPAEAPDWLLDLVDPVKVAPSVKPVAVRPVEQGDAMRRRQAAWCRASLETCCRNIASMGEGGRNDALNRALMAFAGYAASGLLDAESTRAALENAGRSCGLETRELSQLLRGGGPWDVGYAAPRVPELDERPMPRREEGPMPPDEPERFDATEGDTAERHGDPPPGEDATVLDSEGPNLTDLGNARRLVDRYGRDLRFCAAFGGWMLWDGSRWVRDELCRAKEYAKAVPRLIGEEANDADEDGAKALRKWSKASESIGRQEAMVKLATSDVRTACRKSDFDADRWVLNAGNGTIHLKTAEMWDHRRSDLITRKLGANLNTAATCPLWDAFLMQVLGDDVELVRFVQRAVGYSLLGSTEAAAMFILWGNGANGKSTFVEVLRHVFGDYATDTPAETFVLKTATGGASADIAALDGARMVTAAELGDGKSLDEALIKRATGGDPMTARFLYGAFFTFEPQFTLWMSTNHRPIIRGVDEGIWRRLKLIPFTVTIPVEKRDATLGVKLRAEADGILAWALRGLLDYLQGGLREPRAVKAAVEEYRSEMDMLSDFLSERTVKSLMGSVLNVDLYRAYASWARDIGETNVWSHRKLSREMQARGYKQAAGREHGRRWVGIDLTPGALPASDEPRGWPSRPRSGEA